jgi:hypothetical protein
MIRVLPGDDCLPLFMVIDVALIDKSAKIVNPAGNIS